MTVLVKFMTMTEMMIDDGAFPYGNHHDDKDPNDDDNKDDEFDDMNDEGVNDLTSLT